MNDFEELQEQLDELIEEESSLRDEIDYMRDEAFSLECEADHQEDVANGLLEQIESLRKQMDNMEEYTDPKWLEQEETLFDDFD